MSRIKKKILSIKNCRLKSWVHFPIVKTKMLWTGTKRFQFSQRITIKYIYSSSTVKADQTPY